MNSMLGDGGKVGLLAAALGSVRPQVRPVVYHPCFTAMAAVAGIGLAAGLNAGVFLAVFLIPLNNWFASLCFTFIAAIGGIWQVVACVWAFAHIGLDATCGPASLSAADRFLLRVSQLAQKRRCDVDCKSSASAFTSASRTTQTSDRSEDVT